MILKPSKIDLTIEQIHVKSFVHFLVELQNLLEFIGDELIALNETVSVAESVTSGFLQFSFSQVKNAARFFKGGMTAYTLEENISLFHISDDEASFCNGVSPNIVEVMALEVASRYESDWSIAVTGYTVPVKESQHKLYAFFSISRHGKIILSEKLDLHSRTLPLKAQLYYSEFILGCFKLELDKIKLDQEAV
ncbi:CinA family protein [Chryseobacterium camelliae]|uniref:CinA family protein n=1 Tax=Chryseobacterium camelliae TaxID=1265445 RepID=UPI0028575A30|nr:CinA family protein [Chryseobacterium camelliae]MDR6514466.1 PncC family amidohydrolase [Chryseobacterium camelliae]